MGILEEHSENLHEHTEILNEHSGNLDNLEQENEFRINEINQIEIKATDAEIKIQDNTNTLSVVSDDIERIEQILVSKILKMSNLKYLNGNHQIWIQPGCNSTQQKIFLKLSVFTYLTFNSIITHRMSVIELCLLLFMTKKYHKMLGLM